MRARGDVLAATGETGDGETVRREMPTGETVRREMPTGETATSRTGRGRHEGATSLVRMFQCEMPMFSTRFSTSRHTVQTGETR